MANNISYYFTLVKTIGLAWRISRVVWDSLRQIDRECGEPAPDTRSERNPTAGTVIPTVRRHETGDMTLYGVGLGPGAPDLLTLHGERILDRVDVVYSPGRLSRSVAVEHISDSKLGDLDFPMTRDPEKLRRVWKEAAATVAPRATDADAAFVTLDPTIYSTFGHLRRALARFHPTVDIEIVPGVSSVTAFAAALGIEIIAGTDLCLREAADGAAPTGPDRMILFKVTDAPQTHEKLTDAGYDVLFGRRLYMEQGETIITDNPKALTDRDYYTLAYAKKRDVETNQPSALFETDHSESN